MALILKNIDLKILDFIYYHLHNPVLDKVMIFLSFIGNGSLIWIIIASLLLFKKRYRKVSFMLICSLILTSILGELMLKPLIHRIRPFLNQPLIKILVPLPHSFSFPSGHTAQSFAAVGILAKAFKKYQLYIIVLAALIAFSRIYLFVHYPSDVLGGLLLGLACAEIIKKLCLTYLFPDS